MLNLHSQMHWVWNQKVGQMWVVITLSCVGSSWWGGAESKWLNHWIWGSS